MEIDVPPMVERIESRLDRTGATAEETFRAAGLPPGFLEQLRGGKAPVPRGQRLVRLAEALGTSVSYLVGLDPDTEPPQELLEEDQASLGLLAGDEEALLRAYRRLDVPSKAALVLVVVKMAGPEPEPGTKPGKGRRG
ncbi:MAG: transcriptional regulator [Roseomonas sp.]|nr:transcriptional regulator [Roseomonas sp.]